MNNETTFHLLYTFILISSLTTSAYFRHQARAKGGTIPRSAENKKLIMMRLFAIPLALVLFGYIVNPNWFTLFDLHLPDSIRWVGAILGLGTLPFMIWMFQHIGKNVSETILTKENHELITSGPYQLMRHPLYGSGTTFLISLGLLANSSFILAFSLITFLFINIIVIPQEEAALIELFGEQYLTYKQKVGRFFPL